MATLGRANPAQLHRTLDELSYFGRTASGGVTRIAFTEEDLAARSYVMSRMTELGLSIRIDAVGNIVGRLQGTDETASVMTGSHIDGPPEGGKYDGNVGVAGGLEVVRLIRESGVATRRPIDVAVFSAEHLDRFNSGCLGSRAVTGRLQPSELHELKDAAGDSFWSVLRQCGMDPDALSSSRLSRDDVAAFVELHIEQGPVLDSADETVGVVAAISAPTRITVQLDGEANHSGGTPMAMRRDALVAAARAVIALQQCALEEAAAHSVGTVGRLHVEPGSVVTIPGMVRMWVDIRGIDPVSKGRVIDSFGRELERISSDTGVAISKQVTFADDPVSCSPRVTSVIEEAARQVVGVARLMPSGGGHDSQHLATITDVGMIFVRSVRGISHSPDEYSSAEDIAVGTQVLAESIVRLANDGA